MTANDANPWLNYAIPDDGAEPTPAEVEQLTDFYRKRDRTPRLEYVSSTAPAALAALEAGGYALDQTLFLLALTARHVRDVALPDGVEIRVPPESEYEAVRLIQNVAYGDGTAPSPGQIERLRSSVSRGGGVLVAYAGDAPVGTGEFTAPSVGCTEITSVAVLPEFRRKGIAGALTIALSRGALAAGAKHPFLMADTAESRIYRRAGYQDIGEVLTVSQPSSTH